MNILEDPVGRGGGGGGGWYHCSVKPVSRSAGRSVVAAAAYRLGERLHEQATDQVHDYTRRSGVVAGFTLAPDSAPAWVQEPERLWNEAAAAERRKNSTLARECELALPSTVSPEEREAIARDFAQELVDRYGVAVTVALHEPGRHGDNRNFHAHILMTTRVVGEDGFGAKTRILDDRKTGPEEITYLRHYAAGLINEALERAGSEERVDARSFASRGIDREATSHLGPTATEIERRGEASDRGDLNREVAERNEQLDRIVEEIAALDAQIAAEQERRLDKRYGSLDAPAAEPEAPDATEPALGGDSTPIAATDEPSWLAELSEPPAPMSEPQIETLMNQAAAPFLAQIEAHGSVQDGEPEGLRWHERIARKGAELWRDARDWARGTWQSLVANRRERDDLKRDEPDIER